MNDSRAVAIPGRCPLLEGMRILRCLVIVAAVLAGLAGAKKPEVDLRVHAEGTESEAPTFTFPATLLNGTPTYLRRLPLITQREVREVYPFQVQDGSYGVYLLLDSHGGRLLEQFTMERQGRLLVVMLNGRQVSNLMVDRPIKDAIVGIPRGLTSDDVDYLASVFPVTGEPTKKRR